MDNRKLVVDSGEIVFSFRISTKHWSGFPFGLGALACLGNENLGNESATDTPGWLPINKLMEGWPPCAGALSWRPDHIEHALLEG
jgi:hypothetical protein